MTLNIFFFSNDTNIYLINYTIKIHFSHQNEIYHKNIKKFICSINFHLLYYNYISIYDDIILVNRNLHLGDDNVNYLSNKQLNFYLHISKFLPM